VAYLIIGEMDYGEQTEIFSSLTSELRLQLLEDLTHGPASAPDLADKDKYEVTAETIHNNLRDLERVGFLVREQVYGPGNRPRDEFSLAGDIQLNLSVKSDEYTFELNIE